MKRRDFLFATGSGSLLLVLPLRAFCQALLPPRSPDAPKALASDAIAPEAGPISPVVRTGIHVNLQNTDTFGAPTTVWADSVALSGIVATGGHALTIVAREIHFAVDAEIDSRSTQFVATFPSSSAAGAGATPGADGLDGAAGGNGNPGGRVVLIADRVLGKARINASGQNGGGSQNGGPGQKGAPAAALAVIVRNACKKGDRGKPGGRGGLAGKPGDGGDGGEISLRANEIADPSFELRSDAGLAGAPARHGQPGEGGDGGKGGPDNVDSNEGEGGNSRNP